MSYAAPIQDAADLTRHIETRYHARHRQQLQTLIKLAEMIEDLHEPDHDVPEGLTAILRRLNGEMEVHMKKEELLIFPLIRKGTGVQSRSPPRRAMASAKASPLDKRFITSPRTPPRNSAIVASAGAMSRGVASRPAQEVAVRA